MTNTATVQSATADPTTSNNTDTAASTVSTRADIAVTKTVDPVDGVAGAPMTFTITVRNNGPSVGRDVHLDDTVTVDFDFGTLPAGCEVVAGELQCDLGDLDPGATRAVTISGAPSASADPGTYRNSVVASTSTTDPVNANDSARADFTLRTESDAAISKTGDATLTAGDAFSYQVTATTAGPSDARDVTVTDTLPASLVLGSVTTAGHLRGRRADHYLPAGHDPGAGRLGPDHDHRAGASGRHRHGDQHRHPHRVDHGSRPRQQHLYRHFEPGQFGRPGCGQDTRQLAADRRRNRRLHAHRHQPGPVGRRRCAADRRPAGRHRLRPRVVRPGLHADRGQSPAAQPPPSNPSSSVTSGGALAFTGLDVRAYLLLAAVLLAAGVALLQIGRHRRLQE